MKKVLQLFVFTLLLFTTTTASYCLPKEQQKQQLAEAKADLYYRMQEFDKAAAEYLLLLGNRNFDILTNDRISIKFAQNLYLIRDYEEAEKYFGAVIVRNIAAFTPESACAYVATLARNSKFKQALVLAERFCRIPAYKKYQPLQNLITGLKDQSAMHEIEEVCVSKTSFNQPGSNYASVRYKNGIIFVNNEDNYTSMVKEARFFYCNDNGCEPYTKIPHTMQAGPACFYNDGKTILYTDNRYRDGQLVVRKDEEPITNLLRILELKFNQSTQQWEKPKDIFNSKSMHSICHPTVSEDGQRLYFSANIGGENKGMDIYMSKKTAKGWGEPVNLGGVVNTVNTELYPSLHGNILCFTSNGHKGLGGMDIYSVELNESGMPVDGTLKHFPYPVNTIYNDYALIYDGYNGGFFTSDRPGGGNLDAIYSWEKAINVIPKNPLKENAVLMAQSRAFSQQKVHELRSIENMALKLIEGKENPDATVFFEYNCDKLSSAATRAIDYFIDEQNGEHYSVVVLGYADIIGTDERNIKLSTQRAESVKRYMISKGYPESLISAVGKGKLMLARSEQMNSPDIKERLAPARRAEFKIMW